MKNWTGEAIRMRIAEVIPEGSVIPRHNEKGHFYEVALNWFPDGGLSRPPNPVYPSVTGKLQILKDEGLINYKMNRAIEYLRNFVFSGWKNFTEENIMEKIEDACTVAARVSVDILNDAGDIGTRCHDLREVIFKQWIATGIRPTDFTSFIPPEEVDVRVISAMRALEKFCIEMDYIPVVCELLVYSHKLKAAGTLDDLGLMKKVIREGKEVEQHPLGCPHFFLVTNEKSGKRTCVACDYQYRYEFVLMDFKTSNQFKDHYFYQVGLYYEMFVKLMGIAWKPERCFILKVSKEDGSYKIEDLKRPAKLAEYARSIIKTNEGVDFIKSLRKDNQKEVAPLMQL